MAGLTTTEAVQLVNFHITEANVGPEKVRAFALEAVPVDWEQMPSIGRCSKMSRINRVIKARLGNDLLVQLPPVVLLAEDGVANGLFGDDCGMASTETAAAALAAVQTAA